MAENSIYAPNGIEIMLRHHSPSKAAAANENKDVTGRRTKSSKKPQNREYDSLQSRDDIEASSAVDDVKDFASPEFRSGSPNQRRSSKESTSRSEISGRKNRSSSRGKSLVIADSAPLSPRHVAFADTRFSDGSRGSSPRRALQDALPPSNIYVESSAEQETHRNSSPSREAIHSAMVAKSTYLTRKAHRFSSLKKTKAGTSDRLQSSSSLLNRLFCAAPNLITNDSNGEVDSSSPVAQAVSPSESDTIERSRHRRESRSKSKRSGSHSPTKSNESSSEKKKGATGKEAYQLSLHQKSQLNYHRQRISPRSGKKDDDVYGSLSSDSSYVSITNAIQLATAHLDFDQQNHIKKNLKTNFQDAILDACVAASGTSTSNQSSPPTYSTNSKSEKDTVGKSKRVSRGNHFIYSQKHSLQGRETREANEESTEIEFKESVDAGEKTPPTNVEFIGVGLSMKPPQDSLTSRIAFGSPTSIDTARLGSSFDKDSEILFSSDEHVYNIPIQQSSSSEDGRKKTPGKIMIPASFLHSSQSKFVPDQIYTKSSSSSSSGMSPARERQNTKTTQQAEKNVTSMHDEGKDQTFETQMDVASLFGVTRVEMVRANRGCSPPPMIRLTSSLEDLATVPEASTSKETATVDSKSLTDHNKSSFEHFSGSSEDDEEEIVFDSSNIEPDRKCFQTLCSTPRDDPASHSRHYSQEEVENTVRAAVEKALKDWKSKGQTNKQASELQRKLSEQKDQTALANRLSVKRLEEIERLEETLKTQQEREHAWSKTVAETISNEIEKIASEKDGKMKVISDELELVKGKLLLKETTCDTYTAQEAEYILLKQELEQVQTLLQSKVIESDRLQNDLASVKDKLTNKEKEMTNKARGELNRTRKELNEIKEILAAKEKEGRAKTPSKELQRLQKELAVMKKELALKDSSENDRASIELKRVKIELERVSKELEDRKLAAGEVNVEQKEETTEMTKPSQDEILELRNELNVLKTSLEQKDNELEQMKVEFQSTTGSPSMKRFRTLKTPTRLLAVKTSTSKESERDDSQAEIYECEKESLRKEIDLLNRQTAQSSDDHKKALEELREASEKEIQLIKVDMESRLAYHLERERLLKESLSKVGETSSNEKDDLLQQIEMLETAKRTDRTGGLKEVQRKEELLRRISVLEKKQKEETEEHQRSMQDLRLQSESEIQHLRHQMQEQVKGQAVRERELQTALSDTSSYEKEELLEKLETLQNQLESERSGAVLLKIKLSNLEKDYRISLEKLETEKNLEITRVSDRLNEIKVQYENASTPSKLLKSLEEEKSHLLQQVEMCDLERKELESKLQLLVIEKEAIQNQKVATETQHNASMERLKREHEIEITNYKEELENTATSISKTDAERTFSVAKMNYDESIMALEREKDLQIKHLKEQLDKNIGPEDAMKALVKEKEVAEEALAAVQMKLDLELQQRQQIIDDIQKEHASSIASLQQGPTEKLRQTQQEVKKSPEQSQKLNEAKYELKLAEEKAKALGRDLSAKENFFKQRIEELQQKSSEENEKWLEQVESLKNQLQLLKVQNDEHLEKNNQILRGKEDDLIKRIQEVEQNFFEENKKLQAEIDHITQKKDQAESKAEEKYRKDLKIQEQKFSFEKKRLLDQLDVVKSQLKNEEKTIEAKMQQKELEFRDKLRDFENERMVEKMSLLDQIAKQHLLHREDIERTKEEMRKGNNQIELNFDVEKEKLIKQIESLKEEIQVQSDTCNRILLSRENDIANALKVCEEKFESERLRFQKELERLQIEKHRIECTVEERALELSKLHRQTYLDEKLILVQQIEASKTALLEAELRLQQNQQDHTKELDDLLAQLDLVEAEHQEVIKSKEHTISEKVAAVSALSVELGDAQTRYNALIEKVAEEQELFDNVKVNIKSKDEAILKYKAELAAQMEAYQKFVREAEGAQNKACDEAREEMIVRAEAQFQQANEHYVKLRKQYDATHTQLSKVEAKLKDTSKKLELALKERNSCETNLKAEIAQLKTAKEALKTKMESDAVQKSRESRREVDRLKESVKNLEAKAAEAENTSRNIQTTLATVVTDKEKLQREYNEMKSVSEELMAMVEGRQPRELN